MSDDLKDAGFADAEGAREVLKSMERYRLKARLLREQDRSLVVRRQAELLIELLDQTVDHRRLSVFAFLRMKAAHHAKFVRNLLFKSGNKALDSDGHGDLEASKRSDARLELAERLFEIGSFISAGHVRSLSEVADEIATERMTDGHSLSGGAK